MSGSARSTEGKPRGSWIELLRIVAAFAIVWYHGQAPGHDIAYAGLTAFIALSIFLELQRSPDRALDLGGLARRFGCAWVAWSLVFALINVARHESILSPIPIVRAVLLGPSAHLWYLPFMFVVLAALRLLRHHGLDRWLPWIAGAGCIAMLATVPAWGAWGTATGAPIAQYAGAMPIVLFGIVIGALRRPRHWIIAVAVLLSFGILVPSDIFLSYAIGSSATVAALVAGSLRPWHDPTINRIATLTFGIYLMHPAFFFVANRLLGEVGATGSIVAFVLSMASTWLLRHYGGRTGRLVT